MKKVSALTTMAILYCAGNGILFLYMLLVEEIQTAPKSFWIGLLGILSVELANLIYWQVANYDEWKDSPNATVTVKKISVQLMMNALMSSLTVLGMAFVQTTTPTPSFGLFLVSQVFISFFAILIWGTRPGMFPEPPARDEIKGQ